MGKEPRRETTHAQGAPSSPSNLGTEREEEEEEGREWGGAVKPQGNRFLPPSLPLRIAGDINFLKLIPNSSHTVS